MIRILLTGLIGLLFLCANNTISQAQIRWHMAMGAPETNYLGRIVQDFVQEINEQSPDSIHISLYARGSLITQPHIMRSVRTRQVQLGKTLMALHGNEDPFFELEGIPFVATTWRETEILQELMEPIIQDRLAQRGVRMLFSIPWISQGVYTQHPIRTVEDLKGLRLRIYNPVTNRMAALLNTVPMNIVASEMPQAFATNMINAMFTSAQTGVDFAAWDYVGTFTDVGGMRNRAVVIVNTQAFNNLPAAQQQIILAAAQRAHARGFRDAQEQEVTSVNQLRDRGVHIHTASPELMQQLRQVGDQLLQDWLLRAGEPGTQLLRTYQSRITP